MKVKKILRISDDALQRLVSYYLYLKDVVIKNDDGLIRWLANPDKIVGAESMDENKMSD